jgi:pyruvate,orthophosphate dikinase
VKYLVGTMIEVPRGAITAGDVARHAEFFSFGTNDLTQMTFGISRDDIGPVLQTYLARGVWSVDPFVTIDRVGVGALVRMAVEQGRRTRPGLKLGICGEHGGDPASIAFCDEIGLDYVSCSPYRLPIARLAAAQAALREAAARPAAVRPAPAEKPKAKVAKRLKAAAKAALPKAAAAAKAAAAKVREAAPVARPRKAAKKASRAAERRQRA